MNKDMMTKVKEETEKSISSLVENGIEPGRLDELYKLVDIHKDICNENYWKEKEDNMKYGNYGRNSYGSTLIGNYGRRMRDSRGRYKGYGHEIIDDMADSYGAYSESSSAYSRGSYGSKEESMESLNDMLQSVVDFIAMLKNDANSQEELDLIKRYSKTISDM